MSVDGSDQLISARLTLKVKIRSKVPAKKAEFVIFDRHPSRCHRREKGP
jgi:hypothetical protein